MKLQSIRQQIVDACHDLCRNNLMCNLGAGGNVSVRDPETGLVALTPSQVRYDTMSAEDIVVTDVNGMIVEALENRVPTSELETHTMIYREFKNINAVVHAHAPFVTAVTAVEDGLPALNYEQLYFISRVVPVIPFVMPGTVEMAEKVTAALKQSTAMVIRNHGLFAMGGNLAETVVRAVVAEDAARLYLYARSIGDPKLLPADVKKPS